MNSLLQYTNEKLSCIAGIVTVAVVGFRIRDRTSCFELMFRVWDVSSRC